MKKLIMFVMLSLLCSSALCADPPISYDRSVPNFKGGSTYYKSGRVVGTSAKNNTGSHTFYGKSGVEFRGYSTNMGGTRWQASPGKSGSGKSSFGKSSSGKTSSSSRGKK